MTYQIQEQGGGNPTTVDTSMMSDLVLTLFGTDGTTALTSVNDFGIGGTESITNFLLNTAGTYFLRVTSPTDKAQFYSLSASFTAAPVPEPSHVILLSISFVGFLLRRRR